MKLQEQDANEQTGVIGRGRIVDKGNAAAEVHGKICREGSISISWPVFQDLLILPYFILPLASTGGAIKKKDVHFLTDVPPSLVEGCQWKRRTLDLADPKPSQVALAHNTSLFQLLLG